MQVTAVATHGLFVGAAEQVLADPAFCRVIVTDTVPAFRIHEAGPRAKLTQLSCAGMFADALRRMHGD